MSYSFDQQATLAVTETTGLESLVEQIGEEIAESRFGQQVTERPGALEKLRATGLYVSDIEYDCQRLQTQLHALSRIGADGTYGRMLEGARRSVPVDLSSHTELWLLPFVRSADMTPLKQAAAMLGRSEMAHEFVHISFNDALRGFIEQLLPFLRTRLDYARQQAGWGRPPVEAEVAISPGLELKVHTARNHGRVHYSRAYFFNPHDVFGTPTTPATGWIQPGIYIFGVQYPGNSMPVFDQAQFEIPPTTEATLMI